MTEPALRTYFWDFFGPRSGPTAAHFERHLRGFLAQHGIAELAVSLEQSSPLHSAVGLATPPVHCELIEKALRPKRSAP
jgi:hypothetical protein